MNPLETVADTCPYCGETISMQIDTSVEEQTYTEDCSTCCRPIIVQVSIDKNRLSVSLHREDD